MDNKVKKNTTLSITLENIEYLRDRSYKERITKTDIINSLLDASRKEYYKDNK